VALRQEELTGLCDDVDLDRDRALVERCQAGDSAAFGNLYARYYERLLRFCLRRLNDRHEAEDAAQEAFARAWKALPRFAGDKRFYPWLTVIAGNICTDMLRRRSRSTPTDDMELTAQQPVGVVANDTSEELVLAAVDGELVNRALDRLSTRHRHVLAMREGSGWTYQQIADHEGVEIGTIETLLWRARQALKREFAVVSESKEALAGFLIATGALIKRTVFRAAHRGASVHTQSGSGTGGGLRDGLVGAVAITGAAVAAAFVVPHALSVPSAPPAGAGTALAAPAITSPSAAGAAAPANSTQAGASSSASTGSGGPSSSTTVSGSSSTSNSGANGSGGARGTLNVVSGASSAAGSGTSGLTNGVGQTTSGLSNTVGGVTNGLSNTVGGVTSGVGQTVGGVTSGVGQTVSGVTSGLSNTVSGLTNTLGGLGGLLGTGSGGSGSSGNTTGSSATTTTTTSPVSGLVGGVGDTVGGLTGGLGDTVGSLLGG
jgi:RNA polymerase sigma-70 factor (ECF subfamily)